MTQPNELVTDTEQYYVPDSYIVFQPRNQRNQNPSLHVKNPLAK